MGALAENVVRAEMCSIDLWRHIEAMLGSDGGWNQQGVATALNMNVRSVKRLRLLARKNVTVQWLVERATFHRMDGRGQVAGQVIEGGVLTGDPDTVRTAARAMLGQVLSCRDGTTDSGAVACVAGRDRRRPLPAEHGERRLPEVPQQEVMERTASAELVLPRNTGKATRSALTRVELERLEAKVADRASYVAPSNDAGLAHAVA